jgi:SAM-dependent methyltransferase
MHQVNFGMNRCPKCHAGAADEGCSVCGFRPLLIDGFPAYAPDLAREAPGFEASHFSSLAQLEGNNFWFKARNALILDALQRFCGGAQHYLEIGCGTGYVLSAISNRFPKLACWGSEIFVEGLSFAAQRTPDAKLFQMDAQHIPFSDFFDAIGAFDVLEHIEDDVRVIAEMHQALRPGGHAVVTVPQHPSLWSVQDDFAHHVRRYERGELERKFADNGFRIRWSSSFVSLLLPALLLSRLSRRDETEGTDPFAEFRIPRWMDFALLQIMHMERWLIRAGIRFPAGGSRLIVAERSA